MNRRQSLGGIAASLLAPLGPPARAQGSDPGLGAARLPAPLQDLLQREGAAIDIAAAARQIAQLVPAPLPAAGPAELERFALVVQGAQQRLASASVSSPMSAVEALNGFLFEDFGLRLAAADDAAPTDPLAHVLGTRRGDIHALATFYLAVAQRLGLPVQASTAPGHRFLRLVLPGQLPHNIELSRAGASMSDAQYIAHYAIAARSVASGAYLRTLSHREYLAALLLPVGLRLQRQQPALALAALDAALQLNPRDPDCMHRLARFWLDAAREALAQSDRELASQRLGRASGFQRQAEALGWSPGPAA